MGGKALRKPASFMMRTRMSAATHQRLLFRTEMRTVLTTPSLVRSLITCTC
jgi:hypothetical protein